VNIGIKKDFSSLPGSRNDIIRAIIYTIEPRMIEIWQRM
jgi:hypothetical protein